MQGALYFPFIGVPESSWWIRVLLYWDTVATIVPRAYVRDPALHGDYTRDLIRTGLLHQVLPEESGDHLGLRFQGYLDRLSPREIDRRRQEFRRGNVASVHKDKWLTYGAGLRQVERLGLGHIPDDWDGFLAIEATTAAEFMAALALSICESGSRAGGWRSGQTNATETWVPTTDSPPAISALLAGLNPVELQSGGTHVHMRVRGEFRVAEIRSQFLERVLPVPDGQLSTGEIVRFRRRHGDALPDLRRFLEARLDEAIAVEDPVMRARLMNRMEDEVIQRTDEAIAYLRETRIRKISRSSIFRVLKFVPGLKDPIETAQDLAENMRQHASLEAAPLAYLAFARASFAPDQGYRVDPMTGMPLLHAMSQ